MIRKSKQFIFLDVIVSYSYTGSSCKALIGVTIHVKTLLVRDVPFYMKFWIKVTMLERNRWLS